MMAGVGVCTGYVFVRWSFVGEVLGSSLFETKLDISSVPMLLILALLLFLLVKILSIKVDAPDPRRAPIKR